MSIPTSISELSTTAASNAPAGSDSPSTLDDIQRAHASFIAQLRDRTAANWPNTPAGNIGATTVQAAINELDAEKAGLSLPNVFNGGTQYFKSDVQSGYATAAIQAKSNVGDVYIALHAEGATAVALRHARGVEGITAVTSVGAIAPINGLRTILGTVSQAAGVPTGAVIERGSNANGEYVRFADGTQICYREVVWIGVAAGGVGLLNATFAAVFIAAPRVNLTIRSGAPALYAVGTIPVNGGYVAAYAQNSHSATVDLYADVIAVGRWF